MGQAVAFRRTRQCCLSLITEVAQSFWNPLDVATVGRVLEVCRWRCGDVLARGHVFESAGFRVDKRSGEVLL